MNMGKGLDRPGFEGERSKKYLKSSEAIGGFNRLFYKRAKTGRLKESQSSGPMWAFPWKSCLLWTSRSYSI